MSPAVDRCCVRFIFFLNNRSVGHCESIKFNMFLTNRTESLHVLFIYLLLQARKPDAYLSEMAAPQMAKPKANLLTKSAMLYVMLMTLCSW